MRRRSGVFVVVVLGLTGLLSACAYGRGNQGQAQSPEPAEPAGPKVAVVDGSIVFVDCPDSKQLNVRQAQRTIDKLVEACDSVPGGSARFMATLEPGGRIDISAPDGSEDGTVPICVLKHRLKHHMWVRKACKLEVQIQEQSMERAPE